MSKWNLVVIQSVDISFIPLRSLRRQCMYGHSNWTSEVFIQPKFSTEYYSFDRIDLISSIGGNLGLFL